MDSFILEQLDVNLKEIHWLEVFADEPGLFFLDSSATDQIKSRYSFIGFDPFKTIQATGKDSLNQLKDAYKLFESDNLSSADTPLVAGVVGYLSYDYGLFQENIPLKSTDDLKLSDCYFGLYDVIITIDHVKQCVFVTSTGLPETDYHLRLCKAQERICYIREKLNNFLGDKARIRLDESNQKLILKSSFSKDEYCQTVGKVLDYISDGEIYQANLSQRFEIDLGGSYFSKTDLYQTLRNGSPVSFGAYFEAGEMCLISNSPERFLQYDCTTRKVCTRPMKGTRPRLSDVERNQRIKEELLQSDKDKAELLMVTDLERNDLGRVCEFGSVCVTESRTIEEYKTVYQATSAVEGTLRKESDVFDLIKACFPGGSITGCPKIRAMQIIEELEPVRRSVYTGILGYISFGGNMDFNILIRTLLVVQSKIYFHVGGGIVADSTPEMEYEETIVKAQAIRNSLEEMFHAQTELSAL